MTFRSICGIKWVPAFMLLVSASLWGQGPGPSAAGALPAGANIQADLKTKLDTKHAKSGDAITAATMADVKDGDKMLLPKGTKMLGHVISVTEAADGKSPSSITVIFDHAVTPKGQNFDLLANIVSVGIELSNGGASDLPVKTWDTVTGVADGTAGSMSGSGGGTVVSNQADNGNALRASNGVLLDVKPPEVGSEKSGTVFSSKRGNLMIDTGTKLTLLTAG